MPALISFIFPKQIHRLGYLWRILATNAGIGATFAVASSSEPAYATLGIIAIFIYQVFFVVLPRLRDVGMSGRWVLLVFVPFLFVFLTIILLFRPPEFHLANISDEITVKA
jgi:uncharacterized membrane protein YhaH (DUF805 family)